MSGLTAVEAKALAYLQRYGAAIPFTAGESTWVHPSFRKRSTLAIRRRRRYY